jgi:hypothetical protein
VNNWRKSSYSNDSGGDCLETAGDGSLITVRDTKDREGPTLTIPAAIWQRFTTSLK